MSIAALSIDLDLNTGQFNSKITMANGAIRNFTSGINGANASINTMARSTSGLGTKLRDVAVTLGQFRAAMHTVWMFTGQWVSQIIDANAKLERLQMLMGGVSKAATEDLRAKDAEESMRYVLELAKATPFALDELSNAFVKMKAAGIDPTAGSLTALSDSVAAFGGDNQALHRATIAITQMASKGVISMEELRQQLGEAVPDAMRLMARGTNMSMRELVQAVSTGTVEALDAIDRMNRQMALAHSGAGERMMSTWTGLISRLKTEWLVYARLIGEEGGNVGMFAEAKKAIEELIALMKSQDGIEFGREIGAGIAAVIRAVVDLSKFLIENRREIVQYGSVLLSVFAGFKAASLIGNKAIGAFITSIGTFLAGMRTLPGIIGTAGVAVRGLGTLFMTAMGPVGLFITAISMGIAKLIEMKMEADNTKDAVARFYDSLGDKNKSLMLTENDLGEVALQIRGISDAFAQYEDDKKQFAESPGLINPFSRFKDQANSILEANGLPTSEDVEVLRTRMLELSWTLRDGMKQIQDVRNQDRTDRNANAWMDRILSGLEDKKKLLGAKLYSIQQLLEGKEIDTEEASRRYVQATREIYDPFIAELESKLEQIKQANPSGDYLNGNIDSLPKAAQIQYTKLIEAITQTRAARDALINDFTTETTRTGKPKQDFAALKAESALQSLLNSTIAQIERLNQEGDPSSLAEFERLLTDTSKYGKNPDSGMVARLRELLGELDRLKEKDKYRKVLEDINSELDSMDAKALADLDTAIRESSGDVYSDVSRGMAGLNRQLAALRVNIVPGSKEMEEFEARAAKLRDTVSRVDLTNFSKELRDIALAANQTIMTPDERLSSEYQNTTARLRAILNEQLRDFKGSREEKLAIEAQFNKTMVALANQYEFESRTPLQKWVDQYKDVTEEIRDVWAGAMDTITNSIMNMVETGKMSFSDLASSILKELLRVMTSKVVAQFADFIMGMMGGGSGNAGTKVPSGVGPSKSMPLEKSFVAPNIPTSYVPTGKSLDTGFSKSGNSSNVVINLTNESGQPVQAEERGRKFDGQQLVLDIVLAAASRPGRFRESMKGALR